jgi:hypothetical protein
MVYSEGCLQNHAILCNAVELEAEWRLTGYWFDSETTHDARPREAT